MANKSSTASWSEHQRTALAHRLRECQLAIGTQQEAAKVAGISLSQIKNLIAGMSAPSLAVASSLAAASNHSLEWVATGKGPRRPPSKAFATEECENDRAKLIALVNELETERDALRRALGNVLVERALAEVPRG